MGVSISPDLKQHLKQRKQKKWEIYSFYPHDTPGCDCEPIIAHWMTVPRHLPRPKAISCPRTKDPKYSHYKHYEIICKCGERVGVVCSSDKKLTDYFDLHYYCRTDGKGWFGALTLHQSPIDGKVCFQCACGIDTRDFRPNETLPKKEIAKIEKENSVGREFGKKNSKFVLKEVK